MAVDSRNLIQGPAAIYYGAFGATEPTTLATAPGVGWTDLGGTKEGLTLAINTEWSKLTVDQVLDEIGATKSGRSVSAATSLAEATLENLARAINNPAPSGGILELASNIDAFQANYGAILVDGVAPGGKRRRVIIRKVLSTENVEMAYKKDDQTVIPVTFSSFYVSASISPIKIIDDITV